MNTHINDLVRRLQEAADEHRRSAQKAGNRAVGGRAEGAITVQINARGQLQHVEFAKSVGQWSAAQLTEEFARQLRSAQDDLARGGVVAAAASSIPAAEQSLITRHRPDLSEWQQGRVEWPRGIFDGSPQDIQRAMRQRFERKVAAFERTRPELERLRATAEEPSEQPAVRVEVDFDGVPLRVEFTPAAKTMYPHDLSAAVLKAQVAAARRVGNEADRLWAAGGAA
ncbi:MAG: hypothetical protein Q4D79_14470 [Propionibacteriaceae bacterium]|nr:hypothetical protein [Propionibacteriaceae bacterium]